MARLPRNRSSERCTALWSRFVQQHPSYHSALREEYLGLLCGIHDGKGSGEMRSPARAFMRSIDRIFVPKVGGSLLDGKAR